MTATLDRSTTDRAAWLEERKGYIGATDLAAILGMHPYRSALLVYQDKLGLGDPEPMSAAMKRGIKMESYVAEFYAEDANVELRKAPTYRHLEKPHIGVNPDYEALASDGSIDHLVEMKTHNVFMAKGYGPAGTDEVPEHEVIQCQYQMHVSGIHRCVLYVMFGHDDLRPYPFDYDPEVGGMLEEAADRFWIDHILAQIPPDFVGHPSEEEWLKRRFPTDSGQIVYSNPEVDECCAQLGRVKADIDELEAVELSLVTRIKAHMADASVLSSSSGQFTWKATKDTETTDWKAVAVELKAPADLIRKHTFSKPGVRRFLTPFRKAK